MDPTLIIGTLIIGLAILVGFFYLTKVFSGQDAGDDSHADPDETAAEAKAGDGNKKKGGKQHNEPKSKHHHHHHQKQQDKFSHPWLLTSLKGHSGRVLDMDLSENGKYLATCADDRSVLVWSVKDFSSKEHKSHRANVNYDHATKVKWAPDSRAYIVSKASENVAEVYKINRKPDGGLGAVEAVVTFPSAHETDVVGLGFSPTGQYVMTCDDKTTLIVWSIRGEELARADTYHMNTYCAKISPCGRFVATSGFTPDVKVWEVKFSRTGEFQHLSRAFELTGHSSGVYSFAFSPDSSRAATLGKDATWRVFRTDVDFERGQDPEQLHVGRAPEGADQSSVVALSPDAGVVAVSTARCEIHLFASATGESVGTISAAHSASAVTSMIFDKEGRWLLTSGDRHVRVFHNVPGHRAKLATLKDKLRKANTEGMKRNLTEQIDEVEEKLKDLGIKL